MPTCNILNPTIISESYFVKGWDDLCCWQQPSITYDAFLTGITETYDNQCIRDRLFSDYTTQLYNECFSANTDTWVSGGTLNAVTGVVTFTNTTGGTLDVSGFDGFTSYWSASTGGISNSGLTGNVGIGIVTPNEALTVVGAISGTTDLYIGDNIRGLRGQFGNLPSASGANRDMEIKGDGSVYLRLQSTTNASQVIEFMNDQEPDFTIYNKHSDGGLHIASDDKSFLIIGADDSNNVDLNANIIITGNTNISGSTTYIGAVSGTGSVTAIGGFVGNVTGQASTVATIAGLAPNTAPTGTFLLPATAAAQGNITSVGTLTTLTVDNIVLNANTITTSTGHLTINASTGRNVIIFGATFAASQLYAGLGTITNVDSVTVGSTVVTDDSIVMTPSTDDTFTIRSTTNGATSLTTVDTAGAVAHLTVVADGNVDIDGLVVTLDAATSIELEGTTNVTGDLAVDGTSNLDNTDIDGTFTMDGTTFDVNATAAVTIDGTTVSIDGTDDVNVSVTSSTAGEDLTIAQIGANDSGILITAAGTGADAIKIDATAGDMLIAPTLIDGKTLKIGPTSATEMVFTPHGTAANEKISLTNTAGDADDAISIVSTAGGITLTSAASKEIKVGTVSGAPISIGHTTSETTVNGTLTATRKYELPSSTVGTHSGGDIYYYGNGSTVKGSIYYINGTNWTLADADTLTTSTGLTAVALGTDPDVDGMLLRGFVTLLTEVEGTEAIGSVLYLSATAGVATTAAPSGSGDIVRVLGYSLHATDNQVYFNPDGTWVQLA